MIEWVDSKQPTSSWTYLQNFEPQESVKCVSVGWLIAEGEVMALAQNMGDIQDPDNAQVSGVIHIPAHCVVKTTKLVEPEITSSCSDPSSHPETGPTQQAC